MKKPMNKYQLGLRIAVIALILFFVFLAFWVEVAF